MKKVLKPRGQIFHFKLRVILAIRTIFALFLYFCVVVFLILSYNNNNIFHITLQTIRCGYRKKTISLRWFL